MDPTKNTPHLPLFSCPLPMDDNQHIQLAHGGGGRLMHQLITGMFVSAFDNEPLNEQHDGAILRLPSERLAFTTDSYVIRPLFFPGGDIGSLAVHGTVNDLVMCGARPLYLSAGFILEEGLPVETLWKIVRSMARAAADAGVQIVTGDTKVVDRGKGDGVYINTAGVGSIPDGVDIGPRHVAAGDAIIINGDIGRHSIAIMAVREGLEFDTTIESDSAALTAPVQALFDAGIAVHCLRDLTRGGLASTLVEIAEAGNIGLHIDAAAVQVHDDVRAACELLGLDPLYCANEGRFAAIVAVADAQRAVEILQRFTPGEHAAIIGEAQAGREGRVSMRSLLGVDRIVDRLSGEQLPRIC